MRTVNVAESLVLHASDQIFWLDGSSAVSDDRMSRVSAPLQLQLTDCPRDLNIRQSKGKTVMWRDSGATVVADTPDETEKSFTSPGTYTLSGRVTDPSGRYLPRVFSINAGDAPPTGHALRLYPTPLAVHFNRGGGLRLSLARNSDDTPLPWAIIIATVTVPGLGNQVYRAQADQRGEVLMPFLRLPPLAEGISEYSATLSVTGQMDATAGTPLNPDDFVTLELGQPDSNAFSEFIGFSVVPGDISTLRSDGRNFLAVAPA